MSAPTTPAQLVQQWLPRLRRLAYQSGGELDDIQQEAWLLAATMKSGDLVPRWLKAVETHARNQAPGRIIQPGKKKNKNFIGTAWLAGSGDDCPAGALEALEAIQGMLAGQTLDQVVNMPKTTRELALATGKSERQARRDKKRLDAIAALQGDFWGEPV